MSSKKIRKSTNKANPLPKVAAKSHARKAGDAGVEGGHKGKPAKAAPPKQSKGSAAKKPGGLTAAYQVLCTAKEPMRCADLVKESIKRGLWKTNGKTPQATVHAAIIREIAAKGKESRFRKVGRGLFASARKGS